MKIKRLLFVVILFVCILLVGCGEKPTLTLNENEVTIKVGETYSIPAVITGDGKVVVKAAEGAKLEVNGLEIKGLEEGDYTVSIYLEKYEEASIIYNVKVRTNLAPEIKLAEGYEKDIQLETKDVFDELAGITAIDKEDGNLTDKISYNKISTASAGTFVLKYEVTDSDGNKAELVRNITIIQRDETAPVLKLKDGEADIKVLSYGEEYVPNDIIATDDRDGDVSASLKVIQKIDSKRYNVQTAIVEATDAHGNKATIERKVQVVWDYTTMFIGHSGSYYGIQNTEEAFLAAAQSLHYQALECDLKQTSDGVFVMCHDDTFGGKTLASTKWDVLKDVVATVTRNAGIPKESGLIPNGNGQYNSKICTLERYLEICKEYNLIAVIELKSSNGITNNDQSRMSALMAEIEKAGMLNQVTFLGSQYNCLIWVKQNGYDYIPCQYLVNSLESQTYLDRCKQYGLDISINVTDSYTNNDDWLQKYQNEGIKVSTWTFTQYVDYDVVQKWIDKGVDYVTCDWQQIEKLTLYKKGEEIPKHKLEFYGMDNKLLYTLYVKDGVDVEVSDGPKVPGYYFNGWDQALFAVDSDLVVKAMYELDQYTIEYKANNTKKEEVDWTDKDAFVNEFYEDLFNWLDSQVGKMDGLTKVGSTYTLKNNTSQYGTSSWTSAADIKALYVYNFEATISSHIYKQIEGSNSADYVPVPDENYFLNCEAYRVKYQNMNAYLLNCMNTTYTSYSTIYKPASNNRVQIFFRFHQWCNGTKIPAFNTFPKKILETTLPGMSATMPTEHLTYTYLDEFTLPTPVVTGATFLGWYTNPDGTGDAVTEIKKNSSGNLVLYAKWQLLN